jgi:hypothetical protein
MLQVVQRFVKPQTGKAVPLSGSRVRQPHAGRLPVRGSLLGSTDVARGRSWAGKRERPSCKRCVLVQRGWDLSIRPGREPTAPEPGAAPPARQAKARIRVVLPPAAARPDSRRQPLSRERGISGRHVAAAPAGSRASSLDKADVVLVAPAPAPATVGGRTFACDMTLDPAVRSAFWPTPPASVRLPSPEEYRLPGVDDSVREDKRAEPPTIPERSEACCDLWPVLG